jgi:hypothetical protein
LSRSLTVLYSIINTCHSIVEAGDRDIDAEQ